MVLQDCMPASDLVNELLARHARKDVAKTAPTERSIRGRESALVDFQLFDRRFQALRRVFGARRPHGIMTATRPGVVSTITRKGSCRGSTAPSSCTPAFQAFVTTLATVPTFATDDRDGPRTSRGSRNAGTTTGGAPVAVRTAASSSIGAQDHQFNAFRYHHAGTERANRRGAWNCPHDCP